MSLLSNSFSLTTAVTIPRRILINEEIQLQKFCSNKISTCKYNVLTFLPRFLFDQFRRLSNVFFLFISLLQQIPDVSPTGRFTTLGPLCCILTISAIKELFEDLKRRKMDCTVNNFTVLVLRDNHWTLVKWKNLKVGEIVKVLNGQTFPADIVLLASSEDDGLAYIETSNLDGESNLKIRQTTYFEFDFVDPKNLADNRIEISCEQPSRRVNEFNGFLKRDNVTTPLGLDQFMLRGSKLQNTKWIIGAVVYAGHDARLLMNMHLAPLKRTNIVRATNKRILFLFVYLIILALLSAGCAEYVNKNRLQNAFYLSGINSLNFFWNSAAFFILYNSLPISLQVTLEIVRFFQASYINNDLKMYDEASDTCANAHAPNLNEELGQVKYLMTDKTGTLTCNIMNFKQCIIDGINYGNDNSETFNDENLLSNMNSEHANISQPIQDFLLMMATCHTVVPDRSEKGETIVYQASSPDEGALVRGACLLGYVFSLRRPNELVVLTEQGELKLELLNILNFTSDRKRMSVIIRDPRGTIKLFCKGADDVIMERLSTANSGSKSNIERLHKQIDEYASKGYRTLCFATKTISPEDYTDWAKRYHEASISLTDRDQRTAKFADFIEQDLHLLGATAIEDKLQKHVQKTIRLFLEADIRVWILTGDKCETAVNIAQSTALFHKETLVMILQQRNIPDVFIEIHDLLRKAGEYIKDSLEFGLVINGHSFRCAIAKKTRKIFTELLLKCQAVVCCRMTPIQKAQLVELIRIATNEVVMAVGDGANDVAMIQAANVGIGITGEEGLQAAASSDYSIGQFHFLRRLIFVHGTWNFDRSVKVIYYSFYKNFCLYFVQIWFAFFSAFSGQTVFESWSIASFNMFFTSWPPVFLGLFDRPISARLILKNPSSFANFRNNTFSNYRFLKCIGVALFHSIIIFYLTYGYMKTEVIWSNGQTGGWITFGNSAFTFVVIVVNLKILLETDTWTTIMVISCFASILLWFIYLIIYSHLWPVIPMGPEISGMASILYSSTIFWLAVLLIPITTLLLDFVLKGLLSNRLIEVEEDDPLGSKDTSTPQQPLVSWYETSVKFKKVQRVRTQTIKTPTERKESTKPLLKSNKEDIYLQRNSSEDKV